MRHFYFHLIFGIVWLAAAVVSAVRSNISFAALYAVLVALQSAILSVLLEWFHPVRNWKIESDLWHHPRKYVVPLIMLLIAGGIGTWPVGIWVLLFFA